LQRVLQSITTPPVIPTVIDNRMGRGGTGRRLGSFPSVKNAADANKDRQIDGIPPLTPPSVNLREKRLDKSQTRKTH